MSWYQTLAWSFFIRQAVAILTLLSIILWVAYREAERGARATASASLSAGGYILARAFEQQGRSLDAGLEVFTQYSANMALVEQVLESDLVSGHSPDTRWESTRGDAEDAKRPGGPPSFMSDVVSGLGPDTTWGSTRGDAEGAKRPGGPPSFMSDASTSLADTLVENLPRLGADLALVLKPDGSLLASSAKQAHPSFPEVGILQMALTPEEAESEGYHGPFYRGFLRVDWGDQPGIYHAVSRPLRSPGGKPLGAMLVGVRVDDRTAVDLRQLAVAAPQRGDPAPHLALLSQFRTLGSTLPEVETLNRLLSRDPAFLAMRSQVLDGQRSSVLTFKMDGRNYLGMISPIRGVNALDLEMADVLLMPMDPLLAPFRNLQKAILAAGAAGLLVALALSLRSARKVTAPLKALAAAAEALAEGQPPETLAVASTQDEVGVLTRTFKSMLAELRAKDDLLAMLESARIGSAGMGSALLPPARKLILPEAAVEPSQNEATQLLRPRTPKDGDEALPEVLQEGGIFADRYQVEGVLGRGGMGVVLKVRDLQLDEEVALKVIRAGLASDPAFLELLKQEIRLARKITHRHVLRTHDFGECEGIPYVTMEYLKGVTLRSLLDARGRLPLPLALRIARQVAEGLEAAHGVGVVHRDIKPANVLFDSRGDAKIMDFGLAAPVAAVIAGEAGTLVGSPRYMAPEQIRGERVDARTDLYALGVMLFELCSGIPPFDSPRINDLLAMHLEAVAPPLVEAAPDVPADLGALVNRLLEKRQGVRPQSAAEVVETLKVMAAGSGGTSRV